MQIACYICTPETLQWFFSQVWLCPNSCQALTKGWRIYPAHLTACNACMRAYACMNDWGMRCVSFKAFVPLHFFLSVPWRPRSCMEHACMHDMHDCMLGPRQEVLTVVWAAACVRVRRPKSIWVMVAQLLRNNNLFGDGDPYFINQKATWYTWGAAGCQKVYYACMHAHVIV